MSAALVIRKTWQSANVASSTTPAPIQTDVQYLHSSRCPCSSDRSQAVFFISRARSPWRGAALKNSSTRASVRSARLMIRIIILRSPLISARANKPGVFFRAAWRFMSKATATQRTYLPRQVRWSRVGFVSEFHLAILSAILLASCRYNTLFCNYYKSRLLGMICLSDHGR